MLKLSRLFTTLGLVLTPLAAFAQAGDEFGGGHNAMEVLFSIAPYVLIAIFAFLFFIFILRKQQKSPVVKRHQDYLARHEQHMERMEQLLERIAKALEKDSP